MSFQKIPSMVSSTSFKTSKGAISGESKDEGPEEGLTFEISQHAYGNKKCVVAFLPGALCRENELSIEGRLTTTPYEREKNC